MLSYILSLFDQIFIRSWWVFLFIILCFMLYEQVVRRRDGDYVKLSAQLTDLQIEKQKSLKLLDALRLQIQSESDPAWIELVLMRDLGVASEDQTKIFFKK